MGTCLASVLGVAFGLAEPTANPTTGPLRVRVDDPSACVDADRLLAAVVHELPDAAALDAAVDVVADAGALRFELATPLGSVVRSFPDPPADCGQRVRVLALSIALALESLTTEDAPPPVPAPAPIVDAPPPAVATTPRAPEPAPLARARPTWQLAVAGATRIGVAPTPVGVGELQVRRTMPRWAVRIGVAAGSSTPTDLGDGRLRVAVATATADACVRWQAGRAAMLGCAGVEAGAGFGLPRGYQRPQPTAFALVDPVVGFELAAPLGGRWSLLAQAGLAVAVRRPVYRAGRATTTAWPVSPRIGLALAVALGRSR